MSELKEAKIQGNFDFESFQDISSGNVLDDIFEGVAELGSTVWDRLNGGSKSISRYCDMYLPQIPQYFEELHEKICSIFDEEQIPAVVENFEKLASAHIKKYRSSVEKLLCEHEKKCATLDTLLTQTKEDIEFLEKANFQTNK